MHGMSQTMAEALTDVEDLVTCPMCLNIFDSPHSLPCRHSFCLACIRRHCNDKTPTSTPFDCPLCKQNFEVPGGGVEELPCNNHLRRLVDRARSSCSSQSGKKTDAELEALSRRLRGDLCERHGDRATTSHCFDCRQNVCSSCSEAHHRTHSLRSIETLAAELQPKIDADVGEVAARAKSARSEAEKLRTERERLVEDVRRQETAVRQKGEELKSAIDRDVEELLRELERIETDSLNRAQTAETLLRQSADTAQSFCEYLEEIRTKGRPHDAVRYASAIHAQATSLLDQRASSSHDEYTAPCVTFVPADSQALSTCQLLGHISTPLSSAGVCHFSNSVNYFMAFLTKCLPTLYDLVD